MTTVEIEKATDMIWLAMDKLADESIIKQRHGGKMYRKYDENIAVGSIEGNFVRLHKLLSTAMQDLNPAPLDIELLEMADGNPEELKDLLAFSNYNKGFQLVANDEYYSSVTMDAILGDATYSFIMMHDDLGDPVLYIKIHLDRI